MAFTLSRRVKRALIASVGAVAGLVGLIGFAHTPAGRPLLGLLTGAPGCPVNLEQASPEKVEAYRVSQLSRRVGNETPRSHVALGFELGKTDKAGVSGWIANRGTCSEKRAGSVISCTNLGEYRDAHFQFDANQKLVAVDLFHASTDATQSVRNLVALREKLERDVGKPTLSSGEASTAYLTAGLMRRAAYEFSYREYVGKISALNMGKRGISVREQYQWASQEKLAQK
jgi:hypothetical protein